MCSQQHVKTHEQSYQAISICAYCTDTTAIWHGLPFDPTSCLSFFFAPVPHDLLYCLLFFHHFLKMWHSILGNNEEMVEKGRGRCIMQSTLPPLASVSRGCVCACLCVCPCIKAYLLYCLYCTCVYVHTRLAPVAMAISPGNVISYPSNTTKNHHLKPPHLPTRTHALILSNQKPAGIFSETRRWLAACIPSHIVPRRG